MKTPLSFEFHTPAEVFSLLRQVLHLSQEDAEWLDSLKPANLRSLGDMLHFCADYKEDLGT